MDVVRRLVGVLHLDAAAALDAERVRLVHAVLLLDGHFRRRGELALDAARRDADEDVLEVVLLVDLDLVGLHGVLRADRVALALASHA